LYPQNKPVSGGYRLLRDCYPQACWTNEFLRIPSLGSMIVGVFILKNTATMKLQRPLQVSIALEKGTA
jgi:hypothetical protein